MINEMKSTLEGLSIRLDDTKGCISNLEDRIMEIAQLKEQKEQHILKIKHKLLTHKNLLYNYVDYF